LGDSISGARPGLVELRPLDGDLQPSPRELVPGCLDIVDDELKLCSEPGFDLGDASPIETEQPERRLSSDGTFRPEVTPGGCPKRAAWGDVVVRAA
jgi:hypothetical protein